MERPQSVADDPCLSEKPDEREPESAHDMDACVADHTSR
jgi:hypothetical protein